jgi:hypothetical protein
MDLQKITELLLPGDLLLTKKMNRFLIDDMIWFFSKCGIAKEKQKPMISHAAVYIGNDKNNSGQGEIVEQTWGGTRRSKEEFAILFRDYNVYVVRVQKPFNVEVFINGLLSELGIPFGKLKTLKLACQRLFFKIFKIKIRITARDRKKLICGEYVSLNLRKAGYDILPDKNPIEIIPLDFYYADTIEILREVHEETRRKMSKAREGRIVSN